MGTIRKPFQGITNIIRFNWHYYLIILTVILLISIFKSTLPPPFPQIANAVLLVSIIPVGLSILISIYVYDLSGLYNLKWLDGLGIAKGGTMIHITAGFDENSAALQAKFPDPEFHVFNFYDPLKNTEISIRRAIKAYPPFPGTINIDSTRLPLADHVADTVFVLLSAHEIRLDAGRIAFFMELKRVLAPGGKIIVLEHLRDLPNFIAYTIGAFHFFSRAAWKHDFKSANLQLLQEIKITPFMSAFILA